MKIGIISLGCAKNQVDAEYMIGALTAEGHEMTDEIAEADAIFVNTCGFIDSAKQESIDAILSAAGQKRPDAKLYVTGCLSKRYAAELMDGIPEIDGMLGVSEYTRAPELLAAEKGTILMNGDERFPCGGRVLLSPPFTAYVKISDGCDNRCSYCAIPLIRGAYADRPYEEIIRECRELADRGVTEITLIAQDTSRYGTQLYGRKRLSELLKDVARIERVRWVRVLYCYPDTSDDELLDTIAGTEKICPYLDLPLQHIDDRLLKSMNRRGSEEWILSRIRAAKERGITLRTTMIVGYPTETEEEFRHLLAFVEKARFDRLGAFTYSPEEGTVAGEMDGQIPDEVKEERLDRLMTLQQSISREMCRARIGEETEVLCEGTEDGMLFGRSRREAPESDGVIRFTSDSAVEPGSYVRVRITDADEYDLYGEMIG